MTRKRVYRTLWGQRNAGFTLIELLVALALFSLLSTALLGSIRLGTTAWKRVLANTDRHDHILHAQTLLRHIVEDAYPLFLSNGLTHQYVDFNGTKSSLTLLTSTPMALGTGGRSRMTLSIDRRQGRTDLMLTSSLELAASSGSAATGSQTLLTNINAAAFSYFGKARFDRRAEWHDHWAKETQLPRLIRIRVHLVGDDSQAWPDLVIAPRIRADVECVYDPLTRRCRGR